MRALPSAGKIPSDSEANFFGFLRRSFFPQNLRAFHTTVYICIKQIIANQGVGVILKNTAIICTSDKKPHILLFFEPKHKAKSKVYQPAYKLQNTQWKQLWPKPGHISYVFYFRAQRRTSLQKLWLLMVGSGAAAVVHFT